jgi:hypothetical protein
MHKIGVVSLECIGIDGMAQGVRYSRGKEDGELR